MQPKQQYWKQVIFLPVYTVSYSIYGINDSMKQHVRLNQYNYITIRKKLLQVDMIYT